jgi:hypothetical protein
MQDFATALGFMAFFAFVWGAMYLRYRKRREEREMVHRERILAMEKGIPLPEIPVVEENGVAALAGLRRDIFPRIALGCGILLVCVGFGVVVALIISQNRDVREHWSMGFIPMMAGVGLLIYWALLRWTKI